MTQSADKLIWIDLEMTGLNPMLDYIIEIATVITDSQLNLIEEGPVIAVHIDDAVLARMDAWNTSHHTASGLVERVRKSSHDIAAAERLTLEFLQKHLPPHVSPMCGNSICQDRRFLARLMPTLEAYFHYRNLDVSSIKILVNRWGTGKEQFTKESSHRALEDVRDSIAELRFYRERYINI
ncbi:MAG: oligoribonuclease [Gammaproteobacteria bacterium]